MEKQFLSGRLLLDVEALVHVGCTAYKYHHQAGQVVCFFFTGSAVHFAVVYDSEDQANEDMALLKGWIPNIEQIPVIPATSGNGSSAPAAAGEPPLLPAGAKLGSETPTAVKNLQLADDLGGLPAAKLTAYEIGIDANDKYRLLLYRGNSVAYEYLYNSSDDRANDMAVVLDTLPKLQHIGGPEFVS